MVPAPSDTGQIRPRPLLACPIAGDRKRPRRPPMKTLRQRDQFLLPGKLFRQPHRPLDRFRAAVREESLLQLPRHNLRQPLRQLTGGRVVINVSATMHQLIHLRLRCRDDLRMIVPRIHNRNAGKAIEILFAVGAGNRRAMRVLDFNRLEAGNHRGDHVLVVKFFRRHHVFYLLSPEVSCLTVGLVSDNAGMGRPLLFLGLLIIAIGIGIGAIDVFGAPVSHDKLGGCGALKLGWLINAFGFLVASVGSILWIKSHKIDPRQ